jgi:hypothetical protein
MRIIHVRRRVLDASVMERIDRDVDVLVPTLASQVPKLGRGKGGSVLLEGYCLVIIVIDGGMDIWMDMRGFWVLALLRSGCIWFIQQKQ